ncbi:MAG: hypothetical protein D6730_09475 [Bacteroidetes bacterium]|nr:MAG: hypothetical protein D6730_09475 [Bacteroidota bacterium]
MHIPPKLKISNLTNLQDARYCAAMGVDYLSFSLERGSTRKLAPNLIWNIVNWLEGPEVVLELNAFSLDELEEVKGQVKYRAITFPLAEWDERVFAYAGAVILRTGASASPAQLESLLTEAEQRGFELKFELSLSQPAELAPYTSLCPQLFVHLPSLHLAGQLLRSQAPLPYGISLREEAEEAPNQLNYEALDEFFELYGSLFGQQTGREY